MTWERQIARRWWRLQQAAQAKVRTGQEGRWECHGVNTGGTRWHHTLHTTLVTDSSPGDELVLTREVMVRLAALCWCWRQLPPCWSLQLPGRRRQPHVQQRMLAPGPGKLTPAGAARDNVTLVHWATLVLHYSTITQTMSHWHTGLHWYSTITYKAHFFI